MDFKSLEEYYNYLENDDSVKFDIMMARKLAQLHDELENEDKGYCYYEQCFCNYDIADSFAIPKLRYADGSSYPDLSLFDNFDYIKSRAESVVNPKYKAKYNHLLWASPKKHIKYAHTAIENYILLLKSIPLEKEGATRFFVNQFKNVFMLSQTINYQEEKLLDLLFSKLELKEIPTFGIHQSVRFILNNGKKTKSEILQYFVDYLDKISLNEISPLSTEEHLNLIIALCKRLDNSAKSYHTDLAEFYVAQAQGKEDGNFVIHGFYLKALQEYKNAGDKSKVEEITIIIEGLKKKLNFKSIPIELSNDKVEEYLKFLHDSTDEIVESCESDEIYNYLILSKNLIPSADLLNQNIRSQFQDFCTTLSFDGNKNINTKKLGGINMYNVQIQNFTMRQLWIIFSKGFKNGKISFQTLNNYLEKHTWYGEPFISTDGKKYNWIDLLSQGLFMFFEQSKIDIDKGENSNSGYILPIDSLVLKFEGLLREISRSLGAQTIEIKDDRTEERISFDKLLSNQKLVELIPSKDMAFFKFLFTSAGLNLRNNIAHCFYKSYQYNSGIMFLLITALLKLGNYEIKKEK
jgi:hypothetical protein